MPGLLTRINLEMIFFYKNKVKLNLVNELVEVQRYTLRLHNVVAQE